MAHLLTASLSFTPDVACCSNRLPLNAPLFENSLLSMPLCSSVQRLSPYLSMNFPNRHHNKKRRFILANVVTCGTCATVSGRERTTPATPTLYAVLGIDQRASSAEIKSAYRQMARRYHPDVYAGLDGTNSSHMSLRLRETCDVLSDQDLRADYDYDLLHSSWAHAVGTGFPPSSMHRRKAGKGRDQISAACKLQWDAQLHRLHEKRKRGYSNESLGARMRRQTN